jgi:ankyrin repeat protein
MFYTEVVGQIMHYHREELDLSLQDRRGMTIMHWACWTRKSTPKDIANGYGSPTMAGMKHGAYSPLNIRDNCGKSILHFAVERGNIPVVELLLSTPQAEALSAADFSGCNLLHYSVASYRIQLIDFFLQRGFDLNSTDNKSRTVMHYAAMRGNLPAVKKLLDLGASHQLSLKDRDFYTPLQLAVECGSVSVAEYLQPICPLDESKALNRQEHTTRRLQHTQQSNNSDKGVSEYLKLFIRVVFVLSLVSIAGVIYSGGWGRPSTLGCTLAPTIHRTSSLQLFKR